MAPYLASAPAPAVPRLAQQAKHSPRLAARHPMRVELTGTGLVRARARANPASSHEHNQVGPVETTAEAVAMRRVYAFTLIK